MQDTISGGSWVMPNMKLVLLLVLLISGSALAKSASETAADYYAVLKKKDYQGAAAFFDPGALRQFRDLMGFIGEIPEPAQQQFYAKFFGAGESKESIARLSDPAFFASFLRATLAQAEAVGGLSLDGLEILGEVQEGKDVVHVVTRNRVKAGDIEVEAMEVMSFSRRGEGEWKALLSGKMKGLAHQIKAALRKP